MCPLTGGFSLVEVCIAIGIVAFAVLPVAGLLPMGLTTMRQAMNQTAETQILQSISGQAVVSGSLGISQLTSGNAQHFDSEGLPCVSSFGSLYEVTVTKGHPIFPGNSNAAALASNYTLLQVTIKSNTDGGTKSYALQIANSGK